MRARPLRVLMLEDDAADAELVAYELEKAGYVLDARRVADETAFAAALDGPWDLIVADYTLPQFDALRALDLVAAREIEIPVLIVTGSIGEERAVACMRKGAADYFLKDRLGRLGAAVERALEDRRMRGERAEAEAARRRTIRRQGVLLELGRRRDDDLASFLAAVAEATAGEIEAAHVGIWRLAEAGRLLLCDHRHTRGEPPGVATATLEAAAYPAYFAALDASRAIVATDARDDPRTREFAAGYFRDFDIWSTLDVPVRIGGAVVGAVCCEAAGRRREWTDEDVELVTAVAGLVALAWAADGRRRAEAELRRLSERLSDENVYLREELSRTHDFEHILGESPVLAEVLERVRLVAPTDSTVLIMGETGTGKELVARAVHHLSRRKSRPLVKVDCAALPATLIESELFGHDKGAFTGAVRQRAGRFELADGGTIFLDEIGELPREVQAKLLRVLQDGEFERVGGERTRKVDVRVIAATNRDLATMADFRTDLYYRLDVFPVKLPPLRARLGDIVLLARAFAERFAKRIGRPITTIPQAELDALARYDWPGNIRELEHFIERAVILAEDGHLRLAALLESSRGQRVSSRPAATPAAAPAPVPPTSKGSTAMSDVERTHVQRILEESGWRIEGAGGAAERLGLNPNTLRSRMQKLGIRRPQSGSGSSPR